MKCYWMLQNGMVIGFSVSEVLMENQQGGGGGKITSPPPFTQIRVQK